MLMKIEVKKIKPRCGLCGSTRKKLVKTGCCGNWICDDENDYVIFSFARNSCARNHRRFTLCGFHANEDHAGNWITCRRCRADFAHGLEMYVWYGTNEYNFTKLKNPPKYKPTYCQKCGQVIILSAGGYTSLCHMYRCDNCPISEPERKKIIQEFNNKNKKS